MGYQKLIKMLNNTSNQSFKWRTKTLVELNDDTRQMYNTSSQINLKQQCDNHVSPIIVMHLCF